MTTVTIANNPSSKTYALRILNPGQWVRCVDRHSGTYHGKIGIASCSTASLRLTCDTVTLTDGGRITNPDWEFEVIDKVKITLE